MCKSLRFSSVCEGEKKMNLSLKRSVNVKISDRELRCDICLRSLFSLKVRMSESTTSKSYNCLWMENNYISVMI